jgi:hypothetical protein
MFDVKGSFPSNELRSTHVGQAQKIVSVDHVPVDRVLLRNHGERNIQPCRVVYVSNLVLARKG